MTHEIHPWLVVAKTLILVLGAGITYVAARGYGRTRDRTMLHLASGFAIISLGIILQGVLVELLDWAAEPADLWATLVSALGFAIILWSLYR